MSGTRRCASVGGNVRGLGESQVRRMRRERADTSPPRGPARCPTCPTCPTCPRWSHKMSHKMWERILLDHHAVYASVQVIGAPLQVSSCMMVVGLGSRHRDGNLATLWNYINPSVARFQSVWCPPSDRYVVDSERVKRFQERVFLIFRCGPERHSSHFGLHSLFWFASSILNCQSEARRKFKFEFLWVSAQAESELK